MNEAVNAPLMEISPEIEADIYDAEELGVDVQKVSRAANIVVRELQAAGYDAWLVGGCVRDLLLGQAPKDFDVSTNATPEEVRKVFRRARIIGRRFRIVHVSIGQEVIEVTTYRADPGEDVRTSDEGRVLDDNVYGTLEDDVFRRDLTINALYHDPISNRIVDFVGGVDDINDKIISTLGDPADRYREDPVRMVRVLRIAAKTDFAIEPESEEPLQQQRNLLLDVPPSRMFDEILKLFHSGYGLDAWNKLVEYDFHSIIFPSMAEHMKYDPDGIAPHFVELALNNTDIRVKEDKPVVSAFLFAVMLWQDFADAMGAKQASGMNIAQACIQATEEVLADCLGQVRLPQRVVEYMQDIWIMQTRLAYRGNAEKLMKHPRFRAGYDFLVLRSKAGEFDVNELADWWTVFQEIPRDRQQQNIRDLKRNAQPGSLEDPFEKLDKQRSNAKDGKNARQNNRSTKGRNGQNNERKNTRGRRAGRNRNNNQNGSTNAKATSEVNAKANAINNDDVGEQGKSSNNKKSANGGRRRGPHRRGPKRGQQQNQQANVGAISEGN